MTPHDAPILSRAPGCAVQDQVTRYRALTSTTPAVGRWSSTGLLAGEKQDFLGTVAP